jgi:hypothetical protein
MFVKNAWYVIGWSEEITREPMKRTVLDEDVVLYRKQDGTVVALADGQGDVWRSGNGFEGFERIATGLEAVTGVTVA